MDESREACLTFYRRANKKITGLKRGLDKLNYADGLRDIWTAFDGFLNNKGYKGSNKDKREKFAENYKSLFKNWVKTSLFNESIKVLINRSPIKNMDNNKEVILKGDQDLKEILNFAYVPRGNLNHGAKDLERNDDIGQRNLDLVENSFKVVHEILQMVLVSEKWI